MGYTCTSFEVAKIYSALCEDYLCPLAISIPNFGVIKCTTPWSVSTITYYCFYGYWPTISLILRINVWRFYLDVHSLLLVFKPEHELRLCHMNNLLVFTSLSACDGDNTTHIHVLWTATESGSAAEPAFSHLRLYKAAQRVCWLHAYATSFHKLTRFASVPLIFVERLPFAGNFRILRFLQAWNLVYG